MLLFFGKHASVWLLQTKIDPLPTVQPHLNIAHLLVLQSEVWWGRRQ